MEKECVHFRLLPSCGKTAIHGFGRVLSSAPFAALDGVGGAGVGVCRPLDTQPSAKSDVLNHSSGCLGPPAALQLLESSAGLCPEVLPWWWAGPVSSQRPVSCGEPGDSFHTAWTMDRFSHSETTRGSLLDTAPAPPSPPPSPGTTGWCGGAFGRWVGGGQESSGSEPASVPTLGQIWLVFNHS